jgi:hypothetical protein
LLFGHTQHFLKRAEATKVLGQLRELSLDEFGALVLTMPNPHYTQLSALLPLAGARPRRLECLLQRGLSRKVAGSAVSQNLRNLNPAQNPKIDSPSAAYELFIGRLFILNF